MAPAPAALGLHATLTDTEYRRLLEFRTGLRRFLRWSRGQAAAVGLTPTQHQLLLAIRGHDGPMGPTIGDIAGYLLLRPHSALELVDRAATASLVKRGPDPDDQRVVRVRLTPLGARRLERLATLHLQELDRLVPAMRAVWRGLEETGDPNRVQRPAMRRRAQA